MPIYSNMPEDFYPRPSDVNAPLRSTIGIGPRGPQGHSITAEVIDTDPYGYFRVQFKDVETNEVLVTTPNLDVGSRFFVCDKLFEDVSVSSQQSAVNTEFSNLQASSDRSAIRVGDLVFFTTRTSDETFLTLDTIGIGVVNSVNGTNVSFITTNVMTARVADGGITTDMLADLCVTAAKLANNAVTTRSIANLNVTEDKLAPSAVTTDKIASNAVITSKIKDEAVISSKIGPSAVITSKLADASITPAKFNSEVNQYLNDLAEQEVYEYLEDHPERVIPSDEQAEEVITEWLDTHPEATTTVLDGSITTEKIADNTVTDSKLIQSGGVLDKVDNLRNAINEIYDGNEMRFKQTVSGTRNVTIVTNIPVGIYHLTIDNITSSDTDSTTCAMSFRNNSSSLLLLQLDRTSISQDITLSDNVVEIMFFASDSNSHAANDTFTFSNVVIKKEIEYVKEVEEFQSEIDSINNIIIKESVNLYNPSLQTSETISPHYWYNGEPYTETGFDNKYNCTAPIAVEENTQYTLALVPPVSNLQIVKPWNTATQGVFFYDKNGSFISSQFESTTFTTPVNTAYIRFNYYINEGRTITLEVLNASCMLVKGATIPETWSGYYYKTIDDRVEILEEAHNTNNLIWYKRTGTKIEIGYPYSTNKNIIITMQQFGGNNLFDFKKVEIIDSFYSYETNIRTTIFDSGTDCFAPYQVGAINNIDGDDKTNDEYNITFTGGNHGYNNTGSGSTATARMTAITFYANNNEIADNETGYASIIEIKWKNRIQGYNTKKVDGTGREIIEVVHSALFNSSDIKVSSYIYPLEDVIMLRYYGYQMPIEGVFPKYRFYDSQNRLLETYSSGNISNSGDAVGYIFHAEDNSLKNCVEISIDPNFDLGRRQYISNNAAMFVSGAGKFYFNIIRGVDVLMESGSLYALKGTYRFIPVF